MSKIYKLNKWKNWARPLYRRSDFWLVISVVIASLISLLILLIKKFNIKTDITNDIKLDNILISLLILLMIPVVILFIRQIYKIVISYRYHQNYHFSALKIEKQIRKNLINTMTLNTMKQTIRIEVPTVKVRISKDKKTATVVLERLAGMNDIEALTKLVSNSFRKKWNYLACQDFKEADDGLSYEFYLEDVNENKALVPKKIEDLIDNDYYKIKLQKGLDWDLRQVSHAIISGPTGSGKTSLAFQLLLEFYQKSYEVHLVDPKQEYSVFKQFAPNIYTGVDGTLEALETIKNILEERKQRLLPLIEASGEIGATAYTFKEKPVIFLLDEFSTITTSYFSDSKASKLFYELLTPIQQESRAFGIQIIYLSQYFSHEVIKPALRGAAGLRIQLGNSTQEDRKFIFNNNTDTIKDGLVPRFTGYYTLRGFIENPQRFYIADLHKHKLNDIEAFKMAYEKGQKNNDNTS